MLFATEIKSFCLDLDDGTTIEMALVREETTGNYLAIEATYLEREVGPVTSPYQNGTLIFDQGIDGAEVQADCLSEKYSDTNEVPGYPRSDWLAEILQQLTDHGYWYWVSNKLSAARS